MPTTHDSQDSAKEQTAFLAFLATFDLSRPVLSLADLSDGTALCEMLQVVDPDYFRNPSRQAPSAENWVLRFSALKRLYRLMIQYFTDALHQHAAGLDVPDLQAMAKDSDVHAILSMCRLAIVIAVQSTKNREIIDKIQQLNQEDQHFLMKAIEHVMTSLTNSNDHNAGEDLTDDDHYYEIQSERSRLLSEKQVVESAYAVLLEEHRTLQASYDDVLAEKDDALSRLSELRRDQESSRNERSDGLFRAEIDRLQSDLQKSEDSLSVAESNLEKYQALAAELERKVEELQTKADEAVKLKDQLDEYRHASDKLHKMENVMEKYKKKLEEGADLRRRIKTMEDQISSLVDKNATLEEEYRKVSAYKPLLDSYKSQIAELEAKGSSRGVEMDSLKFELEQTKTQLKIAVEERMKDQEALEVYQERVTELENTAMQQTGKRRRHSDGASEETVILNEQNMQDDSDGADKGLRAELDDALSGRTSAELKLEIRKLQRELQAAKSSQSDSSRMLMLESLLDDANRMKARYEAEYLAAHRDKLVLQKDLEDIRNGRTFGDGAEAAMALRQRLNETVDQLDALRKDHLELQVKLEEQSSALTVARADLNLVNKDQLEILASLRESVSGDKSILEAATERLKSQIRELSDKNKMQLEQINKLLMEKVTLQSEGIDQRERMLERERNFSDLRSSTGAKEPQGESKTRFLGLHEENIHLKEQLSTTQSKLAKARAFIKSQDKLFKEEHSRSNAGSPGIFDESEGVYRSQLKVLEDDLERSKRKTREMEARYKREQEVLLSTIHALGKQRIQAASKAPNQQSILAKPMPNSWLGQQRRDLFHR